MNIEEIKEKAKNKAGRAKKWCSDRYWDAKTMWMYHKDEIIGARLLCAMRIGRSFMTHPLGRDGVSGEI